MAAFSEWFFVLGGYLIAFAAVIHIVLERREPTATLAWVLSVVLVPYVGVLLYLLIGRRRLNRHLRRRRRRASALEPRLPNAFHGHREGQLSGVNEVRPRKRALVRLTNRMGCRSPTPGNRVELLVDAPPTYRALEEAIRSAQRHIHLLYYIYQEDDTGRHFRDLLIERAKAGVKVRVLTDGIGSFGINDFMIPLVSAGGRHAEFLPVTLLRRRWAFNLRNHRKLAVIDGRVALTGGGNIGDEYTGKKKKVGQWRETNIRIEGPAVDHVQEIFAEDWYFATGQDPLAEENWFPHKQAAGTNTVQIVGSGPDTDTPPSIQRIFFAAVTTATQRIYLTTPYFVPDQAMLVALQTAALRGVDVRLLLPARSDLRLVLHAGRSYYDVLLASGVRIFEYQAGLLHAKTMVVDDDWATVGSANMDTRSFLLNFEVNGVVFGEHFAHQLADVFRDDLEQANEIKPVHLRGKPIRIRMIESLARTLAPVL